jgi:hypothetical protein
MRLYLVLVHYYNFLESQAAASQGNGASEPSHPKQKRNLRVHGFLLPIWDALLSIKVFKIGSIHHGGLLLAKPKGKMTFVLSQRQETENKNQPLQPFLLTEIKNGNDNTN